MSKVNELINKLCPNGVEFKKIPDIADTFIGLVTTMTKYYVEDGVTLIHNSDIKQGRFEFKKMTYLDNDFAIKNENRRHKLNDVVTVHTGDVGTSAVINKDLDGSLGFATIVSRIKDFNIISPKFLCAFLNSQLCKKQINSMIKGDRNNLNLKDFNNIILPVPPIEIQNEIVCILDNFTLLSAELSAELKARQKQYEYYRNEILKCSENVKIVKFGDVAKIQRGASPRPISQFITDNEDGVNWIKIGDVEEGKKYITHCKEKITIEGSKKSRFVKRGDFILSNSMSFGRPYILAIDGCIHDGWLSISGFQNYYLADFLYHLLNSNDIQSMFKQKASFGGAVQNLNADIVRNIELPLISMEEQQKIVNVLDKFEIYCNDISEGLPAEIEARQKQYEYYRDKLLTFKELKVEK